MATFGNTDVGGFNGDIKDIIKGASFTCPTSGKATNISAALKYSGSHVDMHTKCAIYKHADHHLLGSTVAVDISPTTSYAWYDFAFATPYPSLLASVVYDLCVWSEAGTTNYYVAYADGAVNQMCGEPETYGATWPDPITHDPVSAYTISLHCDYTEAVNYTQTISEILGLSDSMTRRADIKKAISDILGLKDSMTRKANFKILISEILGFKDYLARKKHKSKIGDLEDNTITGGAQ